MLWRQIFCDGRLYMYTLEFSYIHMQPGSLIAPKFKMANTPTRFSVLASWPHNEFFCNTVQVAVLKLGHRFSCCNHSRIGQVCNGHNPIIDYKVDGFCDMSWHNSVPLLDIFETTTDKVFECNTTIVEQENTFHLMYQTSLCGQYVSLPKYTTFF